MANFLDEVYKRHSRVKHSRYYNICADYANKSQTIVKLGVASSFFCSSVYMLYPLVLYLFTGEKFPQLRIYAPGIDENTVDGFIILNLFNCSIIICAIYAIYPVDILTINIFSNIPMVSTIFIERLNDFQGALLQKSYTLIDIKSELLTIIVMYNQYNGYMLLC